MDLVASYPTVPHPNPSNISPAPQSLPDSHPMPSHGPSHSHLTPLTTEAPSLAGVFPPPIDSTTLPLPHHHPPSDLTASFRAKTRTSAEALRLHNRSACDDIYSPLDSSPSSVAYYLVRYRTSALKSISGSRTLELPAPSPSTSTYLQ
ncbi:hypothetical protein PSTG_03882 [Puccinia striiformis f. sp. tritici PST-78]|uniref:Uncharacterized protein n=1 Tax=Puccinia striiformis f. sp. tritici PST-78 TaxID=1165861 RepID=A0A0L0VUH2_9BASI|nr:hypothetical protein PSTG_03882 [Puccinia striiformis f. sp. tritici PST-78]